MLKLEMISAVSFSISAEIEEPDQPQRDHRERQRDQLQDRLDEAVQEPEDERRLEQRAEAADRDLLEDRDHDDERDRVRDPRPEKRLEAPHAGGFYVRLWRRRRRPWRRCCPRSCSSGKPHADKDAGHAADRREEERGEPEVGAAPHRRHDAADRAADEDAETRSPNGPSIFIGSRARAAGPSGILRGHRVGQAEFTLEWPASCFCGQASVRWRRPPSTSAAAAAAPRLPRAPRRGSPSRTSASSRCARRASPAGRRARSRRLVAHDAGAGEAGVGHRRRGLQHEHAVHARAAGRRRASRSPTRADSVTRERSAAAPGRAQMAPAPGSRRPASRRARPALLSEFRVV